MGSKKITIKCTNESDKPESNKPEIQLGSTVDSNIKIFKSIFNNDDTIIYHEFQNQNTCDVKCCIIFANGMIERRILNESIVAPIMNNPSLNINKDLLDYVLYKVISTCEGKKSSNVNNMIEQILSGDTLLLLDGFSEVIIIESKGWKTRSIEEPSTEKIVRGPREGFNESLITNLCMVRRKLRTTDLKFKFLNLGVRSNTQACICYIEGIANEKILKEFEKRLAGIDLDGMLATGYVMELIKDAPLSPFKTIGSTERPDVIAAKLLEGRVALILEGTPVAITVPHVFIEYFQTNDDYYISYYFSSISRLLRIIGFTIATSVPAIYVALTTFHQEMIPTPLIVSIAQSRQGVPFPSIIEAIGLLIVFEIIRETATRTPTQMGQTLSIVGALVIGQAAVDARLVSAPMIIIVALAGITGMIIPKMKGAVLVLMFLFLFLSAFLGMYGYIFGVAGLLIHLFEIRSFGVPFMLNLTSLDPQDLKDTAIRAPWWYMKHRPKYMSKDNKRKASDRREMHSK